MILRGLLIAAAGFVFIFSPGLPLSLLTRRLPAIQRGLIYWGLALWPVSLLPALFLQSLLRQALFGDRPYDTITGPPGIRLFPLVGAVIVALFLQGGMWLVLRYKKPDPPGGIAAGLSLGFGVGLVSQIFTGLSLVGAGFRLMFDPFGDPTLAMLAQPSGRNLALSLLAIILYRPALLVVSAACGLLVARSLSEGGRWWWVSVAISALFNWLALMLQLVFDVEKPGQINVGTALPLNALVAAVYFLVAFGLGYRWIIANVEPRLQAEGTAKSRPSASSH